MHDFILKALKEHHKAADLIVIHTVMLIPREGWLVRYDMGKRVPFTTAPYAAFVQMAGERLVWVHEVNNRQVSA